MVSSGWGIHPYPGEPWGFDNGAWSCFINKKSFDTTKFLKRVSKMEKEGAPILAVTPDIVKAGKKSLDFSNSWIPKLCNGWPWYLAVQDGMNIEEVENSLTKYPYEGVFLGGGDSFKNLQGKQYLALARSYGLRFHFGRCGTAKKIRKAYQWGVDSCDSAFPHWVARRLKVVTDEIQFQESMGLNHLLHVTSLRNSGGVK